ncbi:ABC transporter permease [Aliarcobacter cryaerophilus]|jgi:putative ABC transport system permease protein|uniref:ABC transporter permease n=1 Tax=Aliarcobacter cryaerophilus TaxID=28198 RepID=A0A7G9LLM1_9BACT|nr:ABC transporter permease [Aliarcobacter cryaerophilus]NCB12147.1 FtsX-like permease family protein [Erysipelotrichia bacterium]OQA75934.1 MAG: Macrolide export ATP-binding/permease protein MacB [Candidatus Dependentiae bacterium ADurb.Bin246]MCT7471620.1 ABC transporter permease [Aliarcobacter cryaerophilus]MCT7487815.1 ABC transporter permease [Aliarcobacter cryaerophilus]MCT7507741.1 ABC transporter permease [Aliarcobacter cryaerophilus]
MLLNALLIAIKEIRRNILRSILTILGIVIGVASVIAMVMIGDGTTANVTANIEKLGSNMLNVRVGQEKRGAPRDDNSAKPFKIEDITAIKNEVSNLKGVTAENSSMANVVFGNKSNSSLIVGTTNDYFIIKDWEVEQGRIFEEGELSSGKSVCILGTTVVKNLFGDENPIGATIRIKNFPCSVIGVLASKGASSFGRDQDEVVITPLKMYQRKIQGNLDVSTIIVSVMEEKYIEDAKAQIISLMQDRRAVKVGEADNFHIRDMKDILNTMTSTTKMLTYLLGSIAAISLLVGGIGIMNIMLVSVTERTREIGIRLAIGAMQSEVLLQFLIEAIVLSTWGGIIGIFLGLGVGYGVVQIFELPYIINTQIILISFIFSTLIGVVFGYFPARKAARLNPIDALRYE